MNIFKRILQKIGGKEGEPIAEEIVKVSLKDLQMVEPEHEVEEIHLEDGKKLVITPRTFRIKNLKISAK